MLIEELFARMHQPEIFDQLSLPDVAEFDVEFIKAVPYARPVLERNNSLSSPLAALRAIAENPLLQTGDTEVRGSYLIYMLILAEEAMKSEKEEDVLSLIENRIDVPFIQALLKIVRRNS